MKILVSMLIAVISINSLARSIRATIHISQSDDFEIVSSNQAWGNRTRMHSIIEYLENEQLKKSVSLPKAFVDNNVQLRDINFDSLKWVNAKLNVSEILKSRMNIGIVDNKMDALTIKGSELEKVKVKELKEVALKALKEYDKNINDVDVNYKIDISDYECETQNMSNRMFCNMAATVSADTVIK